MRYAIWACLAVLVTTMVLKANGNQITLLMEQNPPDVVLAKTYRTPEAGLRFYANGSYVNGQDPGPSRFIINHADLQSIDATTPPNSPYTGRPLMDRPFKNSVLVDIQLIKLINDGGILASGAQCDVFNGACDPVCYISYDFQKPNEKYPGAAKHFVPVRSYSDYNSPALDLVFPGSVCARSYQEANVRVYCEDADPATRAELINQWSCPIRQTPAESPSSSEWSAPGECLPVFQPGKIRLTYKYKVYYGNDEACRQASMSGSQATQSRLPPPAAGVQQPPTTRGPQLSANMDYRTSSISSQPAANQPWTTRGQPLSGVIRTTRKPIPLVGVIQTTKKPVPLVAVIQTTKKPEPLVAVIQTQTTRLVPPLSAVIQPRTTRRPPLSAIVQP